MTVEQELERFYGDLRPDPDAERRVIAAVTASATRAARWRPMLVVALSAAAMVVAAALIAVLRPDGRSHSQQGVTHDGPAVGSTVIHGVLTDDGVPVDGARVSITFTWHAAEPRSAGRRGVPAATSDADGAFTLNAPRELANPVGGMVTIEVWVTFPRGRPVAVGQGVELVGPLHWPMQLAFDVATGAVEVNGVTPVHARLRPS